jgi:BlaI family transcriptional regulator, penicillinase repressor
MYIKPTEAELEILNFLWEAGPSTVRAVHEALAATKDVGYTTTLKIMQIMHDKGLLYRTEQGRSHIYVALLGKEETQQNLLGKMVDTVFQGSAAQMVMQALGNHKTSKEELQEIRELLNNLENNQ